MMSDYPNDEVASRAFMQVETVIASIEAHKRFNTIGCERLSEPPTVSAALAAGDLREQTMRQGAC